MTSNELRSIGESLYGPRLADEAGAGIACESTHGQLPFQIINAVSEDVHAASQFNALLKSQLRFRLFPDGALSLDAKDAPVRQHAKNVRRASEAIPNACPAFRLVCAAVVAPNE
jgi:hypothetical protein